MAPQRESTNSVGCVVIPLAAMMQYESSLCAISLLVSTSTTALASLATRLIALRSLQPLHLVQHYSFRCVSSCQSASIALALLIATVAA